MGDIVGALRSRLRTQGPQPLVTYYDLDRAERTELSAISFANWVDKTGHLFDELEVQPGDQVAVPVLAERPGHWIGLVAAMAGWQLGAHVVTEPGPESTVAVVGPDHPWAVNPPTWLTVVAASLHPLGLPLDPPAPVIDFADVLSMPDVTLSYPHSANDPAWGGLTYAAVSDVAAESRRILVPASDPDVILRALVAPLLGGGAAVIVAGSGDLSRIANDERATLVA